MTKSAFTEGDIPNLNYHTIFAEQVSKNNIQRLIPNSFLIASTKRYLLNKENIILGIDKIVENCKDVIIIAINLGYEFNQILSGSKHSQLIINIPATDICDVLFILKKSDLPSIEHKDIKKEEILEYKLVKLNNELKIYSSVIDINAVENTKIKAKWQLENDSLDLKVQIAIAFLCVIYWKKERDIIQINLATRLKEQGIQSKINEIEPLKVDEKEKSEITPA